MPAGEFMLWQAYLRRYPQGHDWQNWIQATLVREIHKGLPHGKNYRIPPLKDFFWKPPPPLFAAAERARAQQRRKPSERRRT